MTTTTDTQLSTWEQNYETKLGEILREKATELTVIPEKVRLDLATALAENVQHAIQWKLAPLVEHDARRAIGEELLMCLDHDEDFYSTPSKALIWIENQLDQWIENTVRQNRSVDFRSIGEAIKGQVALEIRRQLKYVKISASERANNMAAPGFADLMWKLDQARAAQKARLGRVRSDNSKRAVLAELSAIEVDRQNLIAERELHIAQAKSEVTA